MFKLKEVVEGEGEGEEEIVVDQIVEEKEESIDTKVMVIYESVDGEMVVRGQCSLSGIIGYLSFAERVRAAYPTTEAFYNAVMSCLCHVMWPWWPPYSGIVYFNEDGSEKLNPLMMRWKEFSTKVAYAEVLPRNPRDRVVFLMKHGKKDDLIIKPPWVMHIPRILIVDGDIMDLIIHFYIAAYRGLEPDDSGTSNLAVDPWPGCNTYYRDAHSRPLKRGGVPRDDPAYKFTRKELKESSDLYIEKYRREVLGLDDGGEVDDGENEEAAAEAEEEEEEETNGNWVRFIQKLKFIDVYERER